MLSFLKALRRDERGVSALEYAILAAVILAALLVVIQGTDFGAVFTKFGDQITAAGS